MSVLRLPARVALLLISAGALAACSKPSDPSTVVAAPGLPAESGASAAPSAAYSADPTKTGQAYVDELKANPALFEKQKQLCNNHGAEAQPSPALEAPCAAWAGARDDLLIQQVEHGGVKHADSL